MALPATIAATAPIRCPVWNLINPGPVGRKCNLSMCHYGHDRCASGGCLFIDRNTLCGRDCRHLIVHCSPRRPPTRPIAEPISGTISLAMWCGPGKMR